MVADWFSLEGNLVEIALAAVSVVLIIVAFLIGRLEHLMRKGSVESSCEALTRLAEYNQARLDELRKEKEALLRNALRAQESLDRWETVKQDHENIEAMRDELGKFEREESNRIDELERRRAEAARRLADIQSALDAYPPEITGDDAVWSEALDSRKKAFDELEQSTEAARRERDEAVSQRDQNAEEAARLESRKGRLNDEIQSAQESLERIKNDQVEGLKPYNERLLEEARDLQRQIQALDDRKKERERAQQEADAVEAVDGATIHFPEGALNVAVKEVPVVAVEFDEKVGMFGVAPECLDCYEAPRPEQSEDDMLRGFMDHLGGQRLNYPERIVRAFHTALKVNDLSPLTVLSGLSGTGKSQLPRAYARFFGIHFLHVPVEPGWDSPQDLLGFYDFVAERYRPTDRARALAHFDSEFGVCSDRNWSDRMLIILLDEMNLARTEYYFSEFLSRLEMRGSRNGTGNQARSESRILIDLPYGKDDEQKLLYVPHNVLWVGTLNEDETTQALSDKVLDRANSIRFAPPQPHTLSEYSAAPDESAEMSNGYLPYERWIGWSGGDNAAVDRGSGNEIKETLEELAGIMQAAGRGFGYRITQSIKAYIDRYPGEDWRLPMVDQINMRLLPKLSGAEMTDCQDSVGKLRGLAGDELGDEDFAEALHRAEDKSLSSQIFDWPGYTYEERQTEY
ncbi:MAG: hypothetical protein OXH52_12355 [Gammaproteobacteria bacterium]|nr:hypothetical protein [Gammaproteobacteria bacterium]